MEHDTLLNKLIVAAFAACLLTATPAVGAYVPNIVTAPGSWTAGKCVQSTGSIYEVTLTAGACGSGGGGSSPGGSSGNVQYNTSGSFGGVSGLNSDGTNVTAGNGNLKIQGSSSGVTQLNSANAGAINYTATLPASTDTVTENGQTQTLTNKTISGSSNTITNVGNSSLTNSSITIGGQSIALGGSTTNQGTGGKLQLSTGSTTTNDCVKFDSAGNTVDAGSGCSGSGGALQSGTCSNVADCSVDFNSNVLACTTVRVIWSAILPVTNNTTIKIRVRAAGSDLTDLRYNWAAYSANSAGANATPNAAADSSISLLANTYNNFFTSASGLLVPSSSNPTLFTFSGTGFDNSANTKYFNGGGSYGGAVVTGISMLMSSGNISAVYTINCG